eukprot:4045862-Pleurochrysis_carterae.AAC.1
MVQALLAENRIAPHESRFPQMGDSNGNEPPRIKEVAINAATRSPEFVELERRLRGLNVSVAQHQLDALDAAFLSGSIIVTRFLVSNSSDLRGRNPVFIKLGLCMPELITYFTNCQSFDPRTRAIHPNTQRY